jgi:hypothetical protein
MPTWVILGRYAQVAPVSVTFSNLILVNGPPGPSSTYPLGMSTLMMWSIDMDRWV